MGIPEVKKGLNFFIFSKFDFLFISLATPGHSAVIYILQTLGSGRKLESFTLLLFSGSGVDVLLDLDKIQE